MTTRELHVEAARRGLVLRRVPWAQVETVEDIAAGRNSAPAIAGYRELSGNAAAMRLTTAERAELIEFEATRARPRGPGTFEYRLTEAGAALVEFAKRGAP